MKSWKKALGTMTAGAICVMGVPSGNLTASAANPSTSYFDAWTLLESDRYTGNMGDSFVDQIGTRNGYLTTAGNLYSSGIEMWIARWSYKEEKSWAWATYEVDPEMVEFRGTLSVLKNSANTSSYHTTVEILLDDETAYSYTMTPEFEPQKIAIPLEGASTITISVYDDEASEDGTSFCLGNARMKPTFEDDGEDDGLLLGDVDEDGKVAISDAYLTLLAYSSLSAGLDSGLTDKQKIVADVDFDNEVTITDAYKILLYYATKSAGGTPSWEE